MATNKLVLRGGISINGTLIDGSSDPVLTRNTTSKDVGSANPVSSGLSTTLNSAYIYIGNSSNVATARLVSGDITLNNVGLISVNDGVITNSKVASGAGINYSKLSLNNSIVNTDISTSAAIARTKLASGNAYRILVNNGSGVMSDDVAIAANKLIISDANGLPTEALTATYPNLTELTYLKGVTSAIQTQFSNKLSFSSGITPATGDLIYYTGGAWNRLAVGTSGQYLYSNGTTPQWITVPAGMPTGGTAGQYLNKIDGTDFNAQWSTLTLSKVTDVTASVAQVNVLATGFYDATSSVQNQFNIKLDKTLQQNYMFVGNASNIATPLASGANGYILTSVGGVPTWTAPGAGGTVTSVAFSGGTTGLSVTGSPITVSGTITLSGTLIAVNGGTGISSYAVGDILYANSTTTLTKLNVGTNGYVLTLAAGVPTWAATGSGDMVLASVQTVTGAKTFNDTKLLMRNVADTFNGRFTNTNTADRVYTLPNYDGTVATLAGTESLTNKKLGSLTSNGFVKTSSGDGTLSVDTNTYLTGNQSITLSGDITGTGTTSITTTYNGTVPVNKGGTNITSYTIGDLIQASASGVLSVLNSVATGNALISGGVGTVSSWGKIGLTTHISGTLGVSNGGTGTATNFTQGSVVFAGASGIYTQDNANFFYDDTNNRLFSGVTSSVPVQTTLNPFLQVHRTSNESSIGVYRYVNSSGGGRFIGAHSKGATVGTYTAVDSGWDLVSLEGYGSDGTDFNALAGRVVIGSDGAGGAGGAGTIAGNIKLFTSTSAGANTERFGINKDGAVSFSSSFGTQGAVLQSNTSTGAPTWSTFTSGSVLFANSTGVTENNSELFWDNATTTLLLGKTTRVTSYPSLTPRFEIHGLGGGTSSAGLYRWSADTNGAFLTFTKSNSGTLGGLGTYLADGTTLGVITFGGSDQTNDFQTQGVQITANVQGTTADNIIPGSLSIYTANTSGTLTRAIYVDNAQNIGFGTSTMNTKLNVEGGVQIRSTNKLSFTSTVDQTYIHAPASNTLVFGTNSAEVLRINSSGAWSTNAGGTYGTSGQVLISNTSTGVPTWSSAPTLTNVWLLASGGTATGTNTFAFGTNPWIVTTSVSTGTGATSGMQFVANSLTTGIGKDSSTSSVTTGFLSKYTSTSTGVNYVAGTSGLVGISMSGTNSSTARTAVGLSSVITNGIGATFAATNIAAYLEASGAGGGTITNLALQTVGSVLIGNAAGDTITSGTRLDVRGVSSGNAIRVANNTNATVLLNITDAGALTASALTNFSISSTAVSIASAGGGNNFSITSNGGSFTYSGGTTSTATSSVLVTRTLTHGTTIVHNFWEGSATVNGASTGQFTYSKPTLTFTAWGGPVTGYDWNPTTPANISGKHLSIRTASGSVELVQSASTASANWIPAFKSTAGAHTGLTAATEFVSNDWVGATQTWADGTVATQRWNYFRGYTANKTTTSATFTNPYTVYIDPPIAGSGVTFTNTWALGLGGGANIIGRTYITPPTTTGQAQSGAGVVIDPTSLTSGDGLFLITASVTTGSLLRLVNSSTAVDNSKLISIQASGANANSSRSSSGMYITVSNTGTTSTNIGLDIDVYNATTNYGIRLQRGDLLISAGKLFTTSTTTLAAINIGSFAGDPSTLTNGDIWYNSSTGKFMYREAGASNAITGWSSSGTTTIGGNTNQTGAFTNTFLLNSVVITQNNLTTTGGAEALLVTTGTHTNLTASTEKIQISFNASTIQYATGAMARLRHIVFQAPTYSFVGSSSLTDTATLSIEGAPKGGTNASVGSAHGLWVRSSVLTNTTSGFGATFEAPSGATNNYSAQFTGGLGIWINTGNITLDTTTGVKIGTSTSQKLSLWNATPIVQPTTGIASSTIVGGAGTTVKEDHTFDGYTIAQIVKALRNIGALA